MTESDVANEHHQLAQQIELLETKLAFQDDTIEQLNQSIVDLNAELNAVRNDLILLAQKITDSQQNTTDPSQVEIPPHY